MSTNFPKTLGADDEMPAFKPTPFAVPAEEQQRLDAIQSRLANVPAGMSPDEIRKRQQLNQLDTNFGQLMMLTGDEGAQTLGGHVLKQAMEARKPVITEKGWSNPMTGEFTYDPDYLRMQGEAQQDKALDRIAGMRANDYSQQVAEYNRQLAARQRRQDRMELEKYRIENRPVQLVPIQNPDGSVTYGPKVLGATPGQTAQGQPSEGERNASGFADRMTAATGLLDKFESTGRATDLTQTLSALPKVGQAARRYAMTPEQQQYYQAAQDWIRAKLRKESGASIAPDEFAGEYETYFPMPGETDPNVLAQKRAARAIATAAMVKSAGRAGTSLPGPGTTRTPNAAPKGSGTPSKASSPAAGTSRPDPAGLFGPATERHPDTGSW